MRARSLFAAALLCVAGCLGFANDRAIQIDEAVQLYADSLRFGNIDAAARMVEPALRRQFMDLFANPEERALHFTSIDIARVDLDAKAERATVDLDVRFYRLPSIRELSLTDRQAWRYDTKLDVWRVEPDLSQYAGAGQDGPTFR